MRQLRNQASGGCRKGQLRALKTLIRALKVRIDRLSFGFAVLGVSMNISSVLETCWFHFAT